jgi:hypothetical protein
MNARVAAGALMAMVCLQVGSAGLMAETAATAGAQAPHSAATGEVGTGSAGTAMRSGAAGAAALRRTRALAQEASDRAAREATYAADRAMRLGETPADPVLSTAVVANPVRAVEAGPKFTPQQGAELRPVTAAVRQMTLPALLP